VPLTFGQEFGGWASLLERDIRRLEQVLGGLYDFGHRRNGCRDWSERASRIRGACRERRLLNSRAFHSVHTATNLPLSSRRMTKIVFAQGAMENPGCFRS